MICPRNQYIRFTLQHVDSDTAVEQGPFETAYTLRDNGSLPEYDYERLSDILLWFEKNLKSPKRFNKSTSKGYSRRATKGISWFKPTSHSHVNKIRELLATLAEYGYTYNQIHTSRPGYIVYEDEHQIVAEPFSDTITK